MVEPLTNDGSRINIRLSERRNWHAPVLVVSAVLLFVGGMKVGADLQKSILTIDSEEQAKISKEAETYRELAKSAADANIETVADYESRLKESDAEKQSLALKLESLFDQLALDDSRETKPEYRERIIKEVVNVCKIDDTYTAEDARLFNEAKNKLVVLDNEEDRTFPFGASISDMAKRLRPKSDN